VAGASAGVPRSIDLDLLMLGNQTAQTPTITFASSGDCCASVSCFSPGRMIVAPDMLVPGSGAAFRSSLALLLPEAERRGVRLFSSRLAMRFTEPAVAACLQLGEVPGAREVPDAERPSRKSPRPPQRVESVLPGRSMPPVHEEGGAPGTS